VTWPRCKFAIQGRREDGTELAGEYLDGSELKDGLEENMEYFRLDFIDPADVERGDAFEGILPILWLMASAIGERESRRGTTPWYIAKHSPFAVLIQETKFRDFQKELRERKDVTKVFLITDSDDNFGSMRRELGGAASAAGAARYLLIDVLYETRRTQMQLPLHVVDEFFGVNKNSRADIQLGILTDTGLSQPINRAIVLSGGAHLGRLMRRMEMPQIRRLDRPLAALFLKLRRSQKFGFQLFPRDTKSYAIANSILSKHGQQGNAQRRYVIGEKRDQHWRRIVELLQLS
jgi:hypothetical protein